MLISFSSISAATSLIQTVERELSTDWTIPLVFSYQSIFIKNPTNVYNYTAYLEPLKYLSWGIIFLFLIISPVFIYFIWKHADEKEPLSMGASYAIVFVSLILLDTPPRPGTLSTRTVFYWLVYYCLLYKLFLYFNYNFLSASIALLAL